MNKLKKLTTIVTAFLLVIASAVMLTACGGDNKEPQPTTVSVATYSQFVDALKGDGDIIKLTADIDIETTLDVTRNVTFDMNGKKLYNSKDIWKEATEAEKEQGIGNIVSLVDVANDGTLTITGNGSIVAKVNDCYAINLTKGDLVVENGTIKGNCSAIQIEKGTATILGGTFEDQQKYKASGDTQYTYTLNCIDKNYKDNTAKFVVKGGTFINFNPANCKAEGANTNFVAKGYVSKLATNSTTDYVVSKKA